MSDNSSNTLIDLQLVIARQKALGKRLLWLLVLPFLMTAALVYMFVSFRSQILEAQTGIKVSQIEFVIDRDGNYAWGVREYEKVAKSSKSASILSRLGTLYLLSSPGNVTKALETVLEAQKLDPQAWEPYRALTFIYTVVDEPEKAVEAGRKAIQLNPLDANAYNNLAWIYSQSKDVHFRNLKAALDYANQAVSLSDRRSPDYLDTLARVYVQLADDGSKQRGLELFQEAVAISPNNRRRFFEAHLKEAFP